ncbi:MAG: hypothetical protein M1286_02205 [Candidatus Marsarchaeota archaeon]|nr:hypothetical protein [Candidatus Marsarchaeota archaeon]
MDYATTVSLLSLIAISVMYAAFDVFNKRNVPDVFAYASVAVGIAITLAFHQSELVFSLIVALIVGTIGYVVYRLGLWGAGDYFELVAISLILPVQPAPLFFGVAQLGLPFILSVFVGTGFAAIWIVPIYYLFFMKRAWVKKPDAKHVYYGLSLFVLYMLLLLFIYYFYGYALGRLALIMIVAVPSALTLVFEEEITSRMVERIPTKKLEEGDIIAFNMMSKNEMRYFSKYSGFGRLATRSLIARIKNAKMQLPVYRNAAPLALFILIGIGVSLFFGNVVLFMV